MKNPLPFIHHRVIPFGDTDAAAIVYTPRFSNYCMEAAEQWFQRYLRFDWFQMSTSGKGSPVVHMQMDFQSPLSAGDGLGVRVLVTGVGRSTITLGFEGFKANDCETRVVFRATYIYCLTQRETGATPLSDEQRRLIDNYRRGCLQSAAEQQVGMAAENIGW